MISLQYKIGGALLALILTFLGGYWSGSGNVKTVTQVKEVKGDTITKVVDHIVVVTRTVQKDGTVTESTSTEDKVADAKVSTDSTDREKSTSTVLPNWGIGGGGVANYKELLKPEYYLTVDRRILGGIWGEVGATSDRRVMLGVKLEF